MGKSLTLSLDDTEIKSSIPLMDEENLPSPLDSDSKPDSELINADDSTQLEELQCLLEIAHRNEETTKEHLKKITKALATSEDALQKALLNQKEEKINNAVLHLTLAEKQQHLEALESNYQNKLDDHVNESSRLKKVITKQYHLLQSKDHEIAQLIERITLLERNRIYSQIAQQGRQPFFKEGNTIPDAQPAIFLSKGNIRKI